MVQGLGIEQSMMVLPSFSIFAGGRLQQQFVGLESCKDLQHTVAQALRTEIEDFSSRPLNSESSLHAFCLTPETVYVRFQVSMTVSD